MHPKAAGFGGVQGQSPWAFLATHEKNGRAQRAMDTKRLVIAGKVQGVGYRAWMVDAAQRLGVDGWVRNRADGAVEALVSGDPASVEELLRACRRGPRLAEVRAIDEDFADPPDQPGFRQIL